MTPRKGLPVDIYVRVSRRAGRADERFHSPEEQETIARAYAKQRGLKVGIVLTPDIDRSGGTVEREGLKQALSRIRSGESQGFVVAWIDRFSRDAAQAYDLLRQIEDAGGRVYAPEAPEDVSSPEGELQLGMFLLIAQYQRKRARAGFERAKERAILAGIPVGPTPIGYRQRDDRKLEVDPETAPVVRELFERWARGDGRSTLAKVLDEATGRSWSRQAVPSIIKNRLYATGRLEYGEIVSEWDAGAIVDEALWHAAQRAEAPRRPGRSREGWLLSGLLKCGTCGYNLSPTSTKGGTADRVYRSYRCGRRQCTAKAHVNADRIERWVIAQSFDVGDELATRSEAPDLGAIEEQVAVAARRLEQVLAPEAQDALGDTWAATVKARRTEHAELLARLGEARQVAGVPAVEFRLRDVWDGLSQTDRRAALGLFWKAIHVERRNGDGEGTPVRLVARGPHAEAEVELPSGRE